MKIVRQPITISIMNLGTYDWKYYTINDKESYLDALRHFEDNYNIFDNDIEIQIIDHCYYNLSDYNFIDFLDIMEEFPEEDPQTILYLFKLYVAEEVRNILRKGIFYIIIEADNKYEAFEQYIRSYELVEIPEHLECFINWSSMLHSWECGGLNVERLRGGKYLICSH